VFAYFDETTGGDKNDRLDAVAGYLFDASGAAHFLMRYRDWIEPLIPLDEHGRRIFHAAACFDGSDQYFGSERPIREAIMGRMATVIAESVAVGAVVCVEHEQYRLGKRGRYVRVRTQAQPEPDGVAPWLDSMYSMCLHRCIDTLNQWLNLERPGASSVEYVIEQGSPHQAEATQVLDRIATNEKLRSRYRWRAHTFLQKGPESPWLFAADFYAWEWQRSDRLSEEGRIQNERSLLQPALDAKPHLAMYLMEAAVNANAMINAFYGLVRPRSGRS
jgi:hypothetical protein